MPLGTCTICTSEQAKYKCPKCDVQYCSIKCFKSPNHKHDETTLDSKPTQTSAPSLEPSNDSKYSYIFNDEKVKYMLSFKSLQIHLQSIYSIMKNESIPFEKKIDQANEKLTSLRSTGSQENELVEEFCQYITHLLNNKSTSSS